MNFLFRGLTANDWETRFMYHVGLAFAMVGIYFYFKEEDSVPDDKPAERYTYGIVTAPPGTKEYRDVSVKYPGLPMISIGN